MNERPPSPELDADALELLDAYRSERRIPSAVHQRVLKRVHGSIRAQAPARTTSSRRRSSSPFGSPESNEWFRRGVVGGLLVAASLAALWMGAQALSPTPARAPASQAGYERVGGAPGGEAEPDPGEPEGEPRGGPTSSAAGERGLDAAPIESATTIAPPDDDPRARSSARGRARGTRSPRAERVPRPEPEGATADTLAEENLLLGRARAALIDERPEGALSQLAEHERRFPRGVLVQEREALRAVALCEAGREAQGIAAARSFLRAHPQAALAPRVRSACLE